MPINFDALPDANEFSLAPNGAYYGEVEKAEMKQPKETTKKPYLNLTIGLTDAQGKKHGRIFDILSDSESQVVKFKIKRFILATGIPITGNFELSDLAKVVTGKKFIVYITTDEKSDKPRNVVDVFKDDIYYPMSAASQIFGNAGDIDITDSGDDSDSINATDAADSTPRTSAESY